MFQAVAMGDEAARAVLDFYVKALAVGLSNVVNSLDPDVLCLGGGVSGRRGSADAPAAGRNGRAELCPGPARRRPSCLSALGNDAGLVGAAMLYRQHR